MRKIKYLFRDMKNNIGLVVLFFILNTILLLLVGLLCDTIKDNKKTIESINYLRDKFDEAYIVVDITSEERFNEIISNSNEMTGKYKALFEELEKSDNTFFTSFGYDMYINENGDVIREQVVTDTFFDIFKPKLLDGRLFDKEDFSYGDKEVPVLIGYNLQNEYKLGEIYEFDHGGTGESFKGKVIGILEKNSSYYELNNFNVSLSMDFSYIVPLDYSKMNKMGFSDFDMAETRMVVFGEKNEVQKIFSKYSPIDVTLVDVNDKVEYILDIQSNKLKVVLSVVVTFLIIVLVITYIGFGRLFKKQMKEYKIHLFCGARARDIILRFVLLSYVLLMIGLIIASIVFKDINSTLKMSLFSIMFGALSGLYPYFVLRRERG